MQLNESESLASVDNKLKSASKYRSSVARLHASDEYCASRGHVCDLQLVGEIIYAYSTEQKAYFTTTGCTSDSYHALDNS